VPFHTNYKDNNAKNNDDCEQPISHVMIVLRWWVWLSILKGVCCFLFQGRFEAHKTRCMDGYLAFSASPRVAGNKSSGPGFCSTGTNRWNYAETHHKSTKNCDKRGWLRDLPK
jgi:hypothetical protein